MLVLCILEIVTIVTTFRSKPPQIKWIAITLFCIYTTVTHAASTSNPYKLPWKCSAQDGKWVCHEIASTQPSLYDPHLSPAQKQAAVARALGWIPDNSNSGNCSSCDGHYYLPPLPGKNQNLSLKDSTSLVSADSGAGQIAGNKYLQGHVEVIQPGRTVYADQLILYPDPITQQPLEIDATGSVRVQQPGVLLLANNGTADLISHQAELNQVNYLMKVNPDPTNLSRQDPNFTGYGHGQADTIQQLDADLYSLHHATYTTCPPTSNTWKLSASTIDLDTAGGRGYSYNTVLWLHSFPAFYMPYFSFPLNHDRQSGFLYPTPGYGSSTGAWLSIPYYFNLAPNYDWTLTPTIYQRRGILLGNEFRYLSESTQAILEYNYMPHDQVDDDSHTSVNFNSTTQFNPNWQLSTNYNYMSDTDFAQNFNSDASISSINQILYNRQATLQYIDPSWNFNGTVQKYQVLGSQLLLANEPYNLLPQLNLSGQSPSLWGPFNASFTSQFSNFQKDVIVDQPAAVEGQRTNVSPQISMPLNENFGYITPSLISSNTFYQLQNIDATPGYTFPDSSVSRSIPIFSVDSGIYLDRNFNFNGAQYTQTLEPRLYYLYVPYQDQNNIPVFDSSVIPFTYSSLFSNNRFSGLDRIGDANQLSAALQTSVNNQQGQTLWTAAIGQIYYFQDRQVSLCQNTPGSPPCIATENPGYNQPRSDVAAQLTYNLYPNWTFTSGLTYNTFTNQTDSQSYQLQYQPDPQHIFNIGYQDNDTDYSLLSTQELLAGQTPPRLSQITTSFLWPIVQQWSVVGYWNYALNLHQTVEVFGGVQYSSCCWAVRLVERSYTVAGDPNEPSVLNGPTDTATMFQFELKGLGTTSSDIDSYLTEIPGYDPNLSGF